MCEEQQVSLKVGAKFVWCSRRFRINEMKGATIIISSDGLPNQTWNLSDLILLHSKGLVVFEK
jgi:hypothetical protein